MTPGRLSEDDVARLVQSTAAGAATPELEQRVYRESEGLPLFVAEYLAGLDAGVDRYAVALSPHAQGLLEARIAGLGETARQVVGAAAVIGRSFDSETLRRASGRSDDETVGALEELVAHGLVREGAGEGAGYDFSHQKLRALVYEQTAMARRQLLHRRVAAALSGPRAAGEQAALVAQHLRLAGEVAEAAEHYRLAAEHAASLHAHTDALHHLEAALALGHPDVRVIHDRVGDLRVALGDYAGALAAYEAAASYSDPSALAAIEHKLGNLHHRRGEWDRARTHLEEALAAAGDEQPGLRARAQADLALTVLHAGDPGRAGELALDALTLAEAAGDRRAEAQAHNMLGVLARSEVPERALGHLERSLELASELDDAPAEAAALNNLALLRKDEGALEAALELTERALALCSRYGDRHREAALENNLADLHHAAGHQDEAMTHLKRAVSIFREVGGDEAARLPEIWRLTSW